ncbi:MAG: hypothetical protein ABIS67_09890, partial [Candidatus Eisenbacteria bacterium]
PAVVRSTGRFAPLQSAADSFGTFDRGSEWRWRRAEQFEATVSFALPDSFADSARVWPRVGGTMALRGDFSLAHYAPWAEVAERDGRNVTLRGYLYRVPVAVNAGIETAPDSADFWLPLPPDQARIGFTVFGAVDREPPLAALPAGAAPALLHAWPNPSRGEVRISGPPGARIVVLDLAGRVVREAVLDPARGEFLWDCTDPAAIRVPPGLYFMRTASRRLGPLKVIVLD